MNEFNHRDDWFSARKEPFENFSNDDDNDIFEYTLRLPHPPDRVTQSLRFVNGQLVATYRFVFKDPEMLDTGEME